MQTRIQSALLIREAKMVKRTQNNLRPIVPAEFVSMVLVVTAYTTTAQKMDDVTVVEIFFTKPLSSLLFFSCHGCIGDVFSLPLVFSGS